MSVAQGRVKRGLESPLMTGRETMTGTIYREVYQGLSQGSGATKLVWPGSSSGLACLWAMGGNDLEL